MSVLNITDTNGLLDRETDDIPVILMIINHPSLSEPIRLCTDNGEKLAEVEDQPIYGITSKAEDGITSRQYYFCPVSFALPSQHGEEANSTQIVFDNADRMLVSMIRNAQVRQGYPTIRFLFLLVSPDDPSSKDTVLVDFSNMNVTNITYNRTRMTADLSVYSLNGEPFPGRTFTPSSFPSLGGMQ